MPTAMLHPGEPRSLSTGARSRSVSALCAGFFVMAALSLSACTEQPPSNLVAAVYGCDELQATCRTECAGATRCEVDCDAICAQAIEATHCKYDDDTHSCESIPCNDGSCGSVGSTQPTYSDCLAHCASTQPASEPRAVVQSLALLNCSRAGSADCGGGELEDSRQCSYVPASGECHAVSCPAGGSCSSVGSTQPTQNDCYAHCAANQ